MVASPMRVARFETKLARFSFLLHYYPDER
jgi:hypothetical protein